VGPASSASIGEARALRVASTARIRRGCVVPRPQSLLRPDPPPSRLPATSRGSPVIRRPAPHDRTAGAGEGFPSSCAHPPTVPLPIPRRVPWRCTSRLLAPSVAFAVTHPARLPLVPEGCRNEAAGFASCCGPVGCSHHRGFRRCASTPGVSPRRRQPATGLPGNYPDRTPTGWRTQAYGRHAITPRASPPHPRIARALWARCAAGSAG
jgi:hypothetical protein